MKIMNLPEISHQPANDNENTREDIFKEIDILVGMEHQNVLNLKEYYEEGGKVSRCPAPARPLDPRFACCNWSSEALPLHCCQLLQCL